MQDSTTRLMPQDYAGRIRSYVVHSGRITQLQKNALDNLYPKYGVDLAACNSLNSNTVFGAEAPFIIEIGFGMGTATVEIALSLPESMFLGLEVYPPGVGKLLYEIHANSIKNIKVIKHDAVEIIQNKVLDNSVDGFHVFFPDPWPKKKHNKRRLMQSAFVNLLAQRLKKGGYIYFVTDDANYADATLSVLQNELLLQNKYLLWADRQAWRPVTRFEQKAINSGSTIHELFFVKK